MLTHAADLVDSGVAPRNAVRTVLREFGPAESVATGLRVEVRRPHR